MSHKYHWFNHHYSTFLFFAYGIKPDTIIDVGVYDYSFAERYQDIAKRVYAFEPSKVRYDAIKKRETLTQFQSYTDVITIENIAISNVSSLVSIDEDIDNDGCSSLSILNNIPDGHRYITYDINCDTIDNYFSDYEHKIDCIKIDTEGNDINVLRGAITIVNKHRPIIQLHHYDPDMDSIFKMCDYRRIQGPYDSVQEAADPDKSFILKYFYVPNEFKKVERLL